MPDKDVITRTQNTQSYCRNVIKNENVKKKEKGSVPNTAATDKTLLIYQPPPCKGGIAIKNEHLQCLGEQKFLNDIIIDFYLKYLIEEVMEPQERDHTFLFSTFFCSKLFDKSTASAKERHASVKNWTKKVNLFEKDFIIIPINYPRNKHGFLTIICHPNSIVKSEKYIFTHDIPKRMKLQPDNFEKNECDSKSRNGKDKTPCILVFDSAYGMSSLNVGNMLVEYLYWEYKMKINSSIKLKDFDLKCIYPKVPQQHNAFDCGIYVLHYVEKFISTTILDYASLQSLQEWFQIEDIINKRQEIKTLIQFKAKEQMK